MKITTLDPYMAHYVYEKQKDPKAPIVWRRFKKKMVDRVDHIVELAAGNREAVVTQKDWEILGEILKFYAEEWPDDFNSFRESVKEIRRTRRADGYSKSREIKHVASLPPRFERMIKSIFPMQQYDKKFITKLVRKFPVFRVGGEGNMSTGTVIL